MHGLIGQIQKQGSQICLHDIHMSMLWIVKAKWNDTKFLERKL